MCCASWYTILIFKNRLSSSWVDSATKGRLLILRLIEVTRRHSGLRLRSMKAILIHSLLSLYIEANKPRGRLVDFFVQNDPSSDAEGGELLLRSHKFPSSHTTVKQGSQVLYCIMWSIVLHRKLETASFWLVRQGISVDCEARCFTWNWRMQVCRQFGVMQPKMAARSTRPSRTSWRLWWRQFWPPDGGSLIPRYPTTLWVVC